MIKVAEAISDTNIGGAGILLLNRLKHTDKKLFDTTVVLPRNSALKKRFDALGVKVIEVGGGANTSFDLKSLGAYCKAIKRISPDILNAHASFNSRIAGKLCSVPICLYTRHCVFEPSPIFRFSIIKELFSLGTNLLSDGIIAVAHSAKENLISMGINPKKISVIINGAEPLRCISKKEKELLRRSLGILKNHTVVSICARLEEYKDHISFLRAAELLCNRSDRYKFLIIGSGSQEKQLKDLSKKLNLNDHVIFTGFVEDVAPYMNITDINVNCSVGTETSSLALSEGMSLGIPCVASNYGGNPYMVQSGKNGYIYRARNYKELANCIEMVQKNYPKLSANAKKRFECELNSENMSRKTQLYYKLLYCTTYKKGKKY